MFISWFSFFFFKQKTAYEMRISDWSSDVCSSDLLADAGDRLQAQFYVKHLQRVQQRRWAAVDALAAIREAKGPYLACVTADCGGFSIIRSSEERRVGTEFVSTCRSRCSPYL